MLLQNHSGLFSVRALAAQREGEMYEYISAYSWLSILMSFVTGRNARYSSAVGDTEVQHNTSFCMM